MEKNYEPKKTENALYKKWEESGAFQPNGSGTPFTIAIPPPNVTGKLHAGHAMFLTIQDILIRWHRMKGDRTLWIPGTDHAAIATETVVLKNLGAKSREEFSREEFLEKCREWTDHTHKDITHQVKKMGASCDWTREAFTFDTQRNTAVNTLFADLFAKGLLYRGNRLINWSTGAQSVLADDEVEWEEKREIFYFIRCGEFLIGTVRPETKCADSPVVVAPNGEYVRVKYTDTSGKSEFFIFSKFLFENEERRTKTLNLLDGGAVFEVVEEFLGKALVGKTFEYETYAGLRKFTVLADEEAIDIEKGTGAMTISASHSADDYELAKRHNREDLFFQKIDFTGKMTAIAGPCEKLLVKKARKKSAEIMRKKGLLVGEEKNYSHRVPLCYRSGCVIEPMISKQWFIAVEKEFIDDFSGKKTTLKKMTLDAVQKNDVNIIPTHFDKTYFHWIENLRDWCISRQIWWGHRIPVWYDEKGEVHLPRKQNILLLRHGTSKNNAAGIIGENSPLSDTGKEEIEICAQKLTSRKVKKIISSKTKSAAETANILAKKLGLEVEFWDEFSGVDFGKIDGKSYSVLPKNMTTIEYTNIQKTGESTQNIWDRVSRGWEKLKRLSVDGDILLISHRTIFSAIEVYKKGGDAADIVLERSQKAHFSNGLFVEEMVWQKPIGDQLTQDEDTLDTWFSSATWPFSILGWPNSTSHDFQQFYPTTVLETGHDILFFWVARMIMFGRFATGKYPFETVYLHGLVQDAKGQKMSKSKGNGIDPVEIIEKFGTDALRLSLVMGTTPGNNSNLGEEKIAGCRNFCNKLWNIARFLLSQKRGKLPKNATTDLQKWITHKTNTLIFAVSEDLEKFHFGAAAEKLWDFSWNEMADWAVEAAKAEKNSETNALLFQSFATLLRLLHPFLPFLTEQIWQEMEMSTKLLISETWPEGKRMGSGEGFEVVKTVISKIRSMRKNAGVDPSRKITAFLSKASTPHLQKNSDIIILLARLESISFENFPEEKGARDHASGVDIFLPSAGMIDEKTEKQRVAKEIEGAKKQLVGLESKLNNTAFLAKAPKEMVEKTKKMAGELREKIALLTV